MEALVCWFLAIALFVCTTCLLRERRLVRPWGALFLEWKEAIHQHDVEAHNRFLALAHYYERLTDPPWVAFYAWLPRQFWPKPPVP